MTNTQLGLYLAAHLNVSGSIICQITIWFGALIRMHPVCIWGTQFVPRVHLGDPVRTPCASGVQSGTPATLSHSVKCSSGNPAFLSLVARLPRCTRGTNWVPQMHTGYELGPPDAHGVRTGSPRCTWGTNFRFPTSLYSHDLHVFT